MLIYSSGDISNFLTLLLGTVVSVEVITTTGLILVVASVGIVIYIGLSEKDGYVLVKI